MKTVAITLGTIALAAVLVAAGIWLGGNWQRDQWVNDHHPAPNYGAGMMGGNWGHMSDEYGRPGTSWDQNMPCGSGWQGRSMMGRGGAAYCDEAWGFAGAEVKSIDQAHEEIEEYVDRLGYEDLHVSEVMEFEYNYYAIVTEEDSGIGAMELLIDKESGAVGPEPGPNMMWNSKYGMHGNGGMMGGMMGANTDPAGEMLLSPQEAQETAQEWLDANFAGRTAGTPDPFYGYYTLHFLHDGEIEGMLSVHGGTGQVWYHSWHGSFIDMIGEDNHD